MYNLELKPRHRHFWLDKEFDKFFDTFNKSDDFYSPAVDIFDEEKQFTISLDTPGLKQEDISIEVKENQLHISGERKSEQKSEQANVLRTEKRYGKFQRVFTLPPNVNPELIEARFENGVLEIALPKEEKAQARKIAIKN